jgi:hypothetical protein
MARSAFSPWDALEFQMAWFPGVLSDTCAVGGPSYCQNWVIMAEILLKANPPTSRNQGDAKQKLMGQSFVDACICRTTQIPLYVHLCCSADVGINK